MNSTEEKTRLLDFWRGYGEVKEIANVINNICPITKASQKKLNYSKVPNPLYYEVNLHRYRHNDFWFIIDFDIETKNNQKILASRLDLFKVLKKMKQIKYCELSMNQGIHLLVNTNFLIQGNSLKRKIKLKNNIETTLRLEFKCKCLVAPSNDYVYQFSNENVKKMNISNIRKFLKKVFGLFERFELFNFTDGCLFPNFFQNPTCADGSSDDESTDSDLSDFEISELTDNDSIENPLKRKLETNENDENIFKLISYTLNPYYSKLYAVFLNYKQFFDSTANESITNNEFLEFQTNFETFVKNLSKNNSCIYFGDLALFILSILYKDHFALERDHPFYIMSDTDKWITWTAAYLNFTDMLIKNNVSTSYRSNIEFDRHPLYRSITKINEYGSDMTDEESREELDSFRKKYGKTPYFQMNITHEFITFILTTMSIVGLNLEIHFSVNKFLKMFGNVKHNISFGVLLFKRFTSKYKMQIIKTKSKSGSKSGEGFIYMEHLYWQNFQGNENFIDNLISIIYPSLSVVDTERLKSEILQMGTALNLTKELDIVKKNLKKWSHVIPFLNCKLTLRKIEKNDQKSCILINNYNINDTITSVIEYDFPIKDYLSLGLKDGILNLNNEHRYSVYFLSMIKTIFGQDAYSGKLSVFSSIQLLMKLLVIGSFFLKNKVLEVHSILMGPAGSGKSKFLNMIQSIFGDLSKEIHMESYFVSSEMNSSRSNSEETILCFSNETNKRINFTAWKTIIADYSVKGCVRDLYNSVDAKSNHCNASFITAQNADGISYDTENSFILDKEFVRRLFPIYFSLNLGGAHNTNLKTFYKDVKHLKILRNTDPEFQEQTYGALFFILDLIEYFKIGHWDDNNIIKSCPANLRRAVMGQYLPIKILRTQNLIFLDEVYHENSPQMIAFDLKDEGLLLKEELMSTNKIHSNLLTNVNLDSIANSLQTQLKMNIKFCPYANDWKIYGVKRYRECTQAEINAFEMPHKDWFGASIDFNELDAQSTLPPALRFYIHEDLQTKFNKVVASFFLTNRKITFETTPELDVNFVNMTAEKIIDSFKSFQNF